MDFENRNGETQPSGRRSPLGTRSGSKRRRRARRPLRRPPFVLCAANRVVAAFDARIGLPLADRCALAILMKDTSGIRDTVLWHDGRVTSVFHRRAGVAGFNVVGGDGKARTQG